MRGSFLLRPLALVCCLSSACPAADAPPTSVVFLLDCSANMAGQLEAGSGDLPPADPGDLNAQAGSHASDRAPGPLADPAQAARFDVARDALKAAWTTLAADSDSRVALWGIGHRLAWDQADEPGLIEQTRYLDRSQGFRVLQDLLPGDDVELVRPLDRLTPADLESAFDLLDTLEPWGESPLHLGLVRALDNLERTATTANTSVILITSGVNRQWISRFKTAKDDVLEAAQRRPVAIHVIALGESSSTQGEVELRLITTSTRGSFRRVQSAAELAGALDALLNPQPGTASLQAAAAGTRTRGLDVSTAAAATDFGGLPSAGSSPADPAAPAPSTPPAEPRRICLKGLVTYYGRPVRKVRILLEGSALPAAITDAAGQFIFEGVPPGSYTLNCDGIVRNVIRGHVRPLTVAPDASGELSIDVVLE